MKKVKAIRFFHDVLENKDRYANDEFECSDERYEFLFANNAVELIDKLVDKIMGSEEINELIDKAVDEAVEIAFEEKPKKASKKKNK